MSKDLQTAVAIIGSLLAIAGYQFARDPYLDVKCDYGKALLISGGHHEYKCLIK